ncbi:uncharacterized protein PRCAT00002263001 [Priceomyces carsonii]|uniref:uncharacterized protein n=1 Tax=Priceomyces carsonii TaxID=28549 RepID=UPI002ED98EE5|nr:unnamed protein product [Priceomyces carsonii]
MPSDTMDVVDQRQRQRRDKDVQDRRLPQIGDEVIEIASEDEGDNTGPLDNQGEEIVISDEDYTNNDNDHNDTDNNEAGGNEEEDDDDIQITQINHISDEALIRRRRNSDLNLQRRLRRRIVPDGNYEDGDDSVQFVNETLSNLNSEEFLQSLDNHRLDLLRQLNAQLDGAARSSGDTRTGSNYITNIFEEIRRLSQQRLNNTYEQNQGSPRRRLRSGPRTGPPLYQGFENFEQLEGPFHLFGNILSHDHLPPHYSENDVERSIMARIERDNDNAIDSRLASENIFNRKLLVEKRDLVKHEHPGYSNDIRKDSDLCCELCGSTLGLGIPEDFVPDRRYNDNLEFYAKEYRVQAPWFCNQLMTATDKALSKRVFAAKCGHVFCGRCVKNIGNRSGRTKNHVKTLTIDNPVLYAPRKCPAIECGKHFTSKGFTELYF